MTSKERPVYDSAGPYYWWDGCRCFFPQQESLIEPSPTVTMDPDNWIFPLAFPHCFMTNTFQHTCLWCAQPPNLVCNSSSTVRNGASSLRYVSLLMKKNSDIVCVWKLWSTAYSLSPRFSFPDHALLSSAFNMRLVLLYNGGAPTVWPQWAPYSHSLMKPPCFLFWVNNLTSQALSANEECVPVRYPLKLIFLPSIY